MFVYGTFWFGDISVWETLWPGDILVGDISVGDMFGLRDNLVRGHCVREPLKLGLLMQTVFYVSVCIDFPSFNHNYFHFFAFRL